MLIGRTEPRILPPVPLLQWREPSLTQPKDQLGRHDRTRFVIRGWQVDGGLIHERWYDDRAEFDHALWRISIEEPYRDIFWEWATTTVLSSGAGSDQTYNVPADWNSGDNHVDTIGGGASGAASGTASITRNASGASGGGFGRYTNLTLTPSGTADYRIGSGAAGVASGAGTASDGNNGNDTWFNGASYAAASVGGLGGLKGVHGQNAVANGGAAVGGKGTSSQNSGRGGNCSTTSDNNRHASGGGGAGGPNGAGVNGGDLSGSSNEASAGGAGDGGSGGTGGTSDSSTAAGNGTNLDGGVGAGGSGGGRVGGNNGANGGNYGGASGGISRSTVSCTSGNGIQGVIIVTYTAAVPTLPQLSTPDIRREVRMVPYDMASMH